MDRFSAQKARAAEAAVTELESGMLVGLGTGTTAAVAVRALARTARRGREVKRIVAAGARMTLLSARPPSGLLPITRQLGIETIVGAFNGGTLVDEAGKILFAAHLKVDVSRTAIELIRRAGANLWIFADGCWFVDDPANSRIDGEKRSSMVAPQPLPDLERLHGRIDMIVAVSDTKDTIPKIVEEGKALLGATAEVASSQRYHCDFTDPEASKGPGIARIAQALGIPLAETMALGDMYNDLPMFERAGFSVAMGQAPDPVKAVADRVSRSNDEDGVAAALDYVLGMGMIVAAA